MKLAINQATTMPYSFERDIEAYAEAGFDAVELWLDKVNAFLSGNSLAAAGRVLADNGIKPVGACYHCGVMLSEGSARAANMDELRAKLEICRALGVPVLVVPTDFPERDPAAADYERAVAGIGEAADLAQAYNVALAVEFVKGSKLVASLGTALDIVRKAGTDNLGVLFDTFHFYGGPSKERDMRNMSKDELLLVHINDVAAVPVEIARDADRTWPGRGCMPLKDLVAAVEAVGYEGYYSIELFNEEIWAMDVGRSARALFEKTARLLGGE